MGQSPWPSWLFRRRGEAELGGYFVEGGGLGVRGGGGGGVLGAEELAGAPAGGSGGGEFGGGVGEK